MPRAEETWQSYLLYSLSDQQKPFKRVLLGDSREDNEAKRGKTFHK